MPSRRRASVLAAGLLVFTLSGCVAVPTREAAKPAATDTTAPPQPADLAGLTAYLSWLRKQPPEQLHRLRDTAESQPAAQRTDFDRLRLAMLLSLPKAHDRDPARAQTLLGEIVGGDSGNSDLKSFARLMLWNLEEREQLRKTYDRELALERDQRRKLQHQLQELKAIEEQLNRRDNKPLTKP